jgi:hypothetical protein
LNFTDCGVSFSGKTKNKDLQDAKGFDPYLVFIQILERIKFIFKLFITQLQGAACSQIGLKLNQVGINLSINEFK